MPAKRKTGTKDITARFMSEVKRSLLMEDSEKEYWRMNSDKMPKSLIRYFYEYLKKQNDLMDSYIKKALDDHPELVAEIKAKTKKIRKTLAELRGAEDANAAEKLLEDQMKQI